MIKTLVKSAVGFAAPRVPAVQRALDRGLSVFCYHDVADHPSPFSRECGLAVSPERFERQLRWIAQDFHVIALDALLAGEVPPRAALITFDDGFASVFRTALPILRRHGLPSTVFLNMASVSGEPCWGARTVYLCRHVEGFLEFLADGGRSGRASGCLVAAPVASPSLALGMLGERSRGDTPRDGLRQFAFGSQLARRLWLCAGNLRHRRRSTRTVDPLEAHVHCSPEIVAAWEARSGDRYLEALSEYTGPSATAEDLAAACDDPLVTFGDHAYHHYSLRVLPEAAVRESLRMNAEALKAYRNSRPVFAFPFGVSAAGQPELVNALGYKRIFTVRPLVNRNPASAVLHRIPITGWHDRRSRFWYQVGRAALEGRS